MKILTWQLTFNKKVKQQILEDISTFINISKRKHIAWIGYVWFVTDDYTNDILAKVYKDQWEFVIHM